MIKRVSAFFRRLFGKSWDETVEPTPVILTKGEQARGFKVKFPKIPDVTLKSAATEHVGEISSFDVFEGPESMASPVVMTKDTILEAIKVMDEEGMSSEEYFSPVVAIYAEKLAKREAAVLQRLKEDLPERCHACGLKHQKLKRDARTGVYEGSGCITLRTPEGNLEYYPGGQGAGKASAVKAFLKRPRREDFEPGLSGKLAFWTARDKYFKLVNDIHPGKFEKTETIELKRDDAECQCITCTSLRESGVIKRPEGYQGNLGTKNCQNHLKSGAITVKTVAGVLGLMLMVSSIIGLVFAADARLSSSSKRLSSRERYVLCSKSTRTRSGCPRPYGISS